MTDTAFDYCDSLGPSKILHVHEPAIGLRGILVVDNVAAGPSIGGLRMASDVSLEECFRLARAMTFKNAAAGLPHGGGKSVIFADPADDESRKEDLVRAFAQAIGPIEDYIVGPDMGTNETAMGWVRDEIGRCVGLPREVGGIPLDEIGATGYGLAVSAATAEAHGGPKLDGARVAVQGYGAVGQHAARHLAERGAVLVAAADSRGTVYDPAGLDVEALIALKDAGKSVLDHASGEKLDRDAIIGVDCDIWIPAARPDVIREDNVSEVKARLIVQGANIGVTESAEVLLHQRGVICIPDFISNAGGVICASVEYHGGTETQALKVIEEKIRANTAEVLGRAELENRTPYRAAVAMAEERVVRAMQLRRWK
jgi:glutamate dehydrogenase (NAD(P)+)